MSVTALRLRRLFRWRAIGWVAKRVLSPGYVTLRGRSRIDFNVRYDRNHGTIDIGDAVVVFRDTELLAPVVIGDGTFINKGCYLRAKTTIGRNVNVGPFVKFVTDTHEISNVGRRAGANEFRPILVEDGAWIGAAAVILGGVTVGRGAIVGAGAVVTRDVEPNTIVTGNPARRLRSLDDLA